MNGALGFVIGAAKLTQTFLNLAYPDGKGVSAVQQAADEGMELLGGLHGQLSCGFQGDAAVLVQHGCDLTRFQFQHEPGRVGHRHLVRHLSQLHKDGIALLL
ncbi:hypothetical protein D3C75_1024770 [compost metagenome]